MDKKIIKNNIVRDYKLKNAWLKNEYKKILIYSILQNKKICKYKKIILKNLIINQKIKDRLSAQKRTCILLGKNRSVYPKLNLKRHSIKKLNSTCLITNLNMGKW